MDPPAPVCHSLVETMKGDNQQVRQGQPDRAQLQQARSFRIENAARYVDVRDGVAVEQHIDGAVVVEKRKNGDKDRQPHQPHDLDLGIRRRGPLRLHSRCVSSRKI